MPKCHTTQVACNENKNENDVGNHPPKEGNLKCSRSQARQNGVKNFCCRNRENIKNDDDEMTMLTVRWFGKRHENEQKKMIERREMSGVVCGENQIACLVSVACLY